MNQALVDKIVQAVLYEGYILYPYRPSVKNHHRWTFGGLYPRAYSEAQPFGDAWSLQAECIVTGTTRTILETRMRFLHLTDRKISQLEHPVAQWPPEGEPSARPVPSLTVNGKQYRAWQEAVERDIPVPGATIGELLASPQWCDFSFPAGRNVERLSESGKIVGELIRQQQAIEGAVEISAAELRDQGLPESASSAAVFKITMRIFNRTALAAPAAVMRDDALMRALVSTHALISVRSGELVSMTDPPSHLRNAVEACKNIGVWPVLVGDAGEKDTILASPIILYDYPQIAPESPGDLFDGTEIDEILTLRVMTLTDDEKREVAAVDDRAAAMLKRTESLAREQLMGLHGTMRNARPFPATDELPAPAVMASPNEVLTAADVFPVGDVMPAWDVLSDKPKLPSYRAGGVELRPGDRVRLCPRGGADAFDMMLAGKTATIAAIEQDYEDKIHLAVTVEDDPGADLGVQGKPGHRFFFRPDEVELLK